MTPEERARRAVERTRGTHLATGDTGELEAAIAQEIRQAVAEAGGALVEFLPPSKGPVMGTACVPIPTHQQSYPGKGAGGRKADG